MFEIDVAQAGLELTEIHLPQLLRAGIKDIRRHAWPITKVFHEPFVSSVAGICFAPCEPVSQRCDEVPQKGAYKEGCLIHLVLLEALVCGWSAPLLWDQRLGSASQRSKPTHLVVAKRLREGTRVLMFSSGSSFGDLIFFHQVPSSEGFTIS